MTEINRTEDTPPSGPEGGTMPPPEGTGDSKPAEGAGTPE